MFYHKSIFAPKKWMYRSYTQTNKNVISNTQNSYFQGVVGDTIGNFVLKRKKKSILIKLREMRRPKYFHKSFTTNLSW